MEINEKYKIACTQRKGIIQLEKLEKRIEDLRNLCMLLEKSGDKKSADKNVVPKLNEAIALRYKLLNELDNNRRQAAKSLIMTFISCDIATDIADSFADVLNKISYGEREDNDFTKIVKQQAHKAREIAKEWGKIVEIIDDSNDYPLEMFYANVSESIEHKVIGLIGSEIDKVMATHKGKQMF